MKNASEQTRSIWMATGMPTVPPLTLGAHADVCIVGAGIAGPGFAAGGSPAAASGPWRVQSG